MTEVAGIRAAQLAAQAMQDKKADDVVILDMRGVIVDADYFVIGSCPTLTQSRAVTQSVRESLDTAGLEMRSQEGRRDNKWVLLDYGDVIIHVFLAEEREFYNLEKLWADAKRIPIDGTFG